MIRKTTQSLVLAAAVCLSATAWAEEAPPLFSPEPPEADAATVLAAYLDLLAAGQYEQALAVNDLRGMRQYLLDRRLADLKAKNPEMTAKDLAEISAQFQTNELNPARLQTILLDIMREGNYPGMTWRIRGYAPAPEGTEGYLASIEAQTPGGQEKPILVGLVKLGEQWRVAPQIVEALASRQQTTIHAFQRKDPPGEVLAQVDAFWNHWQAGTLNEAYALVGADYRARVALLDFLQKAQEFIAQAGIPSGWQVVQGLEPTPGTFWLGVNIQGSLTTKPTLMLFQKKGETWILQDIQLQMPRTTAPGPAGTTAAPPGSRSDLRPDLKPDLTPAQADTAAEPPPNAPPAAVPPVHIPPAAPVGPDAP